MLSINEVLDTSPYSSPKQVPNESLDTPPDLISEQVALSEVFNHLSITYHLLSPNNKSFTDSNLDPWLLDSEGSCCVTHDCAHMLNAKPSDKVIVVGNGLNLTCFCT